VLERLRVCSEEKLCEREREYVGERKTEREDV
jgi:hypothetical protein